MSMTCNDLRLVYSIGWVKICFKFAYEELATHRNSPIDPDQPKSADKKTKKPKTDQKILRVHIELSPVKINITEALKLQIKHPIIFRGLFKVDSSSDIGASIDLLRNMDF